MLVTYQGTTAGAIKGLSTCQVFGSTYLSEGHYLIELDFSEATDKR